MFPLPSTGRRAPGRGCTGPTCSPPRPRPWSEASRRGTCPRGSRARPGRRTSGREGWPKRSVPDRERPARGWARDPRARPRQGSATRRAIWRRRAPRKDAGCYLDARAGAPRRHARASGSPSARVLVPSLFSPSRSRLRSSEWAPLFAVGKTSRNGETCSKFGFCWCRPRPSGTMAIDLSSARAQRNGSFSLGTWDFWRILSRRPSALDPEQLSMTRRPQPLPPPAAATFRQWKAPGASRRSLAPGKWPVA